MLDIGSWELLVIVAVMALILSPKDMHTTIRMVKKVKGKIGETWADMANTIEKQSQEETIEYLRKEAEKAASDRHKDFAERLHQLVVDAGQDEAIKKKKKG